jgi:tRNA nucleotidyltransferase (CCA-adding enzyme)
LGKLLLWTDAARLCRFAPLLRQVIPELAPTMGFDQKSRHHAYDVFTHTAHVVQAVAPTLPLRWAALLHDIGKPGCFHVDEAGEGHFYDHASQGAAMAETVLRRLKAPNALREQVVTLIRQHMTKISPERKAVRRWMGRLGGETLEQLLQLQEADMGSKGTGIPPEAEQFTQLRQLMQQLEGENACLTVRQLAINGHDLLALGYAGPQIGRILQALLQQVLDEQLPNERDALLQALPKG